MRILHVVASEKWTGAAAVVWDWTQALSGAGVEAQFAFVGGSHLARRLGPLGAARPLFSRAHGFGGVLADRRRLRDTLLREPFDVVHAHLSHDHYLALAAVRGTGSRLVRTIHHLDHVRRDPFSRFLFRRTSAFSYANRAIARRSSQAGPVHSPAVDSARFAPGARPLELLGRLGAPGGAWVAGTVGKMARGRGHEEAIEAAARVNGTVLLHVGKGEHQPALLELAARLGSAGRNIWAGYQEEALPDLYRGMDVFLFTASGSQQGQRAILEAMASGLPVVALPVPGVLDLLTDGVEGIVANDVAGLSAALQRLRSDEALRRRLGEAARQRALAFTAEEFAAQAIAFYERVLSARGGPTASSAARPDEPSPTPGNAPATPYRPDR
ncbi:MAG TPA: glycosyltransferase family 4 protein [Thermoanaerobaculia bacterium]|nr:glycosyltransferase family 4 protein [Thermoanaerobaculia bacterium]